MLIEEDLDEVLFRTLTDRLVDAVGVDTRKQRLDSTGISSFMRSLTRLGILVEATSKFLRELRRIYPDLCEQVEPNLWRKYVDREGDGCFALTTPSASKRRLPEAATDAYALLKMFETTDAATLESFLLLRRVFEEQCELEEVDDEQISIRPKDPKEIPCDNVLNPADPDASYNKHRGVGYLVQVMESYSGAEAIDAGEGEDVPKEDRRAEADVPRPDLITHVAVGKMNVHDSAALVPALEDTQAREIAPELLTADTHYGSNDALDEARTHGTELIAPSMPPKGSKQGKLTLENFELDEAGRIVRCPQGHAPVQTSASSKRLQAQFDESLCSACPLRNRCVAAGKQRLQYTHDRVGQRRRRLAEQEPYFRAHYRWRAGIEATMSRLKHQMGLAYLRVRGMAAVQYRGLLRALGLNIHRVALWHQSYPCMAA